MSNSLITAASLCKTLSEMHPKDLKRLEQAAIRNNKEKGEFTKLSDEDLITSLRDVPLGERWVLGDNLGELVRRYENKKKEVRLYGDHLGGCEKRPCTCGFKEAYE